MHLWPSLSQNNHNFFLDLNKEFWYWFEGKKYIDLWIYLCSALMCSWGYNLIMQHDVTCCVPCLWLASLIFAFFCVCYYSTALYQICSDKEASNPNIPFTLLTVMGSPVFWFEQVKKCWICTNKLHTLSMSSLILTQGFPSTAAILITIFKGLDLIWPSLDNVLKSFVRKVPIPNETA